MRCHHDGGAATDLTSSEERNIIQALEEIPKLTIENAGGVDCSEQCLDPDYPSCPNCGADQRERRVDLSRGDLVCSCGHSEAAIALAQCPRGDVDRLLRMGRGFFEERGENLHQTEMGLGAVLGAKGSAYKPAKYFKRRLELFTMRDGGAFTRDDWARIEAGYRRWQREKCPAPNRSGTAGAFAGPCPKTREDVAGILVLSGDGFKREFLQHWLAIRCHLSGVKGAFETCPLWLLEDIQERFDEVACYCAGAGIRRLYYDFILARLFDLYGRHDVAAEFPKVVNMDARFRLSQFWKGVCNHLNWPYINSDE